ncbi:hypothetical protein JG687_00012772, partial [Phytophthora cactorum]
YWRVLPQNTVVEVDYTADVESLYSGYCGPSDENMECGLDTLWLFYFSCQSRYGSRLHPKHFDTGTKRQSSAQTMRMQRKMMLRATTRGLLVVERRSWLN